MPLHIQSPHVLTEQHFAPFFAEPVPAGFASPTSGYEAAELNLHDYCVKNKTATFFVRATGSSMIEAGISDNDVLVVDRSLNAEAGNIVIAAIDNEFTVKLLNIVNGAPCLMPMNPQFQPIYPNPDELCIWGVVTYIIKRAELCSP